MEDWEKKSDLTMAPQDRHGPRMLDEQELAERDIELHHPKVPRKLWHKTAKPHKEAYAVYQE